MERIYRLMFDFIESEVKENTAYLVIYSNTDTICTEDVVNYIESLLYIIGKFYNFTFYYLNHSKVKVSKMREKGLWSYSSIIVFSKEHSDLIQFMSELQDYMIEPDKMDEADATYI